MNSDEILLIKRRSTATVWATTTAFAEEAVRIHEGGHLSDRQIARATGAAPSTVRSWLNGRSAPTGARAERIAELSALVSRLRRVVDADYIPVWMTKPVEALDDEKPIDVLARGEYRRVAAVVRGLEHPGAA
ncbi:MAG: helix-turn-helix domain-containing protein [Actinobacteria bacterium]|nr:MAG: helix-turn-helix domain-containing protein [Actinomycetota bacterium]